MTVPIFLFLLVGTVSASPVGEDPGVTAAPVLLVPLGSRALGMGGAFTAVAEDASALYYNPAGLARMESPEAGFTFISGQADNNLQHIAYGGPLPLRGVAGAGAGHAGASLLFSQSGTIEVNRTNPDGSFSGTQNLNAGSDLVLGLGYAEKLAESSVDMHPGRYTIVHYAGVGGKMLRSTLVEQYSATAFAGDVGYLADCPELGASFGAAALNFGSRLRYAEVADPLPTSLRTGVAYRPAKGLLAATDGDYLLHERLYHVEAGLEYEWARNFAARAGYRFLRDAGGLTLGFGLAWQERLRLDYAFLMGSGLSDSHRVTISYRFSPDWAKRQSWDEKRKADVFVEDQEDKPKPSKNPPPRRRPPPPPQEPQSIPGWIY